MRNQTAIVRSLKLPNIEQDGHNLVPRAHRFMLTDSSPVVLIESTGFVIEEVPDKGFPVNYCLVHEDGTSEYPTVTEYYSYEYLIQRSSEPTFFHTFIRPFANETDQYFDLIKYINPLEVLDISLIYWFIDPCYGFKEWPSLGIAVYMPQKVEGYGGNWNLRGNKLLGTEISVDSGQIGLIPETIRLEYINKYHSLRETPVTIHIIDTGNTPTNYYGVLCLLSLAGKCVLSTRDIFHENMWISSTAYGDGSYSLKKNNNGLSIITTDDEEVDMDEDNYYQDEEE